MEIKIFVVRTEIEKKAVGAKAFFNSMLKDLKCELIQLFGGLTEIRDAKGYWKKNTGEIIEDTVDIWLVYPNKDLLENLKEFNETVLNQYANHKFRNILGDIRRVTEQTVQAWSENTLFYSINY